MKFIALLAVAFFTHLSYGQITVTNSNTPEEYVSDTLLGVGAWVTDVTYNGLPATTISDRIGHFDAFGTTFPIEKGMIISTGNVNIAPGPNTSGGATGTTSGDPVIVDPDLNTLIGGGVGIFDETVLEFDFTPLGDSLIFNYIFASEEYPEFVDNIFNDAFAIFVSGPGISGPYTDGAENIALIPGTSSFVAINNLNNGTTETGPCMNCTFYISNAGGIDVEYDAYTTVLKAAVDADRLAPYHIKIAIADVSDAAWDSALFLEEKSLKSVAPYSSINELELKNYGFTVFPVPSASEVTVAFKEGLEQGNIEILSMDGRVIHKQALIGQLNVPVILPEAPGQYILRVSTEGAQLSKCVRKI